MCKTQQGFTLIELMMVVAILGILVAIALPAYQDYTKRTYVSEGLSVAAGAKSSVSEYYGTNGVWPADNSATGIAAPSELRGNAVSQVSVATGVITIQFNNKVDNQTLTMSPTATSGAIRWTCSGGSLDRKYVPSNCR